MGGVESSALTTSTRTTTTPLQVEYLKEEGVEEMGVDVNATVNDEQAAPNRVEIMMVTKKNIDGTSVCVEDAPPVTESFSSSCTENINKSEQKQQQQQQQQNKEEVVLGKRKRKARQDSDFAFVSDYGERRSPEKRNGKDQHGSNNKKSKQKSVEDEFDTCWICAECKEAECMMKPEADQLIICEGKCRRLFHYPCVGLSALPEDDVEYVCPDCTHRRHRCAICQDYGWDEEDVVKCSRTTCGLFFHPACLAMQNIEVYQQSQNYSNDNNYNNQAEVEDDENDDSGNASNGKLLLDKIRFVCPAHNCWTCTQHDLKEQEEAEKLENQKQTTTAKRKKKGKVTKSKPISSVFDAKSERYLIHCIECPVSYHVSCIPPTARFHELALLCHKDASRFKLPELDAENSIQTRIEQKANQTLGDLLERRQRLRSTKAGGRKDENKFFPGLRGDAMTKREKKLLEILQQPSRKDERENSNEDDDDMNDNILLLTEGFSLPCDVQSEVYSVPPKYRHVTSLQYNPAQRPQKIVSSGETCQCIGFCGDDCLNRMLYTECFGDTNRENGKSATTNCSVGPQCGNRVIGQRKAVKCKPQRERGRGWGLVSLQKILRGDFVHEYVGEVIHEKEKEQRLTEWNAVHPNDHNFYIMSLSPPDYYVDAREQGNLSRFINHSCDPNCVLLQINVGGHMRCCIFAKRDIEVGEFLSYDYHFDTKQGDRFLCRCGAPKCRGTMKKKGSDINGSEATKKSKLEMWDEAKARYERDKKFVSEHCDNEQARLNQVSHLVPEAENPQELVANGAQARYRSEILRSRVFLWRNAVRGSDFASRLARLEQNKKNQNL